VSREAMVRAINGTRGREPAAMYRQGTRVTADEVVIRGSRGESETRIKHKGSFKKELRWTHRTRITAHILYEVARIKKTVIARKEKDQLPS